MLEKLLTEKFHLETFRSGQREIIDSIAAGNDVLAVMPTGGGKSLCFQLPSLLTPGITIVVSPLLALMNDQVKNLRALGIAAGGIHSGVSLNEKKKIFSDMQNYENYILYVSPERVQKPGFAPWLKSQKINLFAIDEAHCVSKWGHDFRPEYSQLAVLREYHPDVPMVALTATATPQVKRDISRQLTLKSPHEHVYGFYRPNLYYQVEFCEDEAEKAGFVFEALKMTPEGRVIIYCGTRKKTEEWATLLSQQGESVGFYHAGLSTKDRVALEKAYADGDIRVLAATNAFGMGIDHPDVRLVVHTQMPGNIESYYQEIGRAGRDGLDATCLMTYSKKDKGLQSYFITQAEVDRKIKVQRWSALNAIIHYAEGSECRHGDILTYFKDRQRLHKCGHCDSCRPSSPRRVFVTEDYQPPTQFKLRKKKVKKLALDDDLDDNQTLRAGWIRDWRKAYANKQDIPAFMVFSDKTLKDIVLRAPETLEDLQNVYGLGEKKIQVFGEDLLKNLWPEKISH